jgi:FkbM family methyltransferase
LLWRLLRSKAPVTVRLRHGHSIILRPPPADDLVAAVEVFICHDYEPPKTIAKQLEHALKNGGEIRDLGANVGYSILFFAGRFPSAKISAFEPIPEHIDLLRKHIQINQLTPRVDVYSAAAGNRDGSIRFIVDGICSKSANNDNDNSQTILVDQIDVLSALEPSRIALLKIDIEGTEFELLEDPRFDRVFFPCVVVEWHKTVSRPNAETDCRQLLERKGYRVLDGNAKDGSCGIFWAYAEGAC